MKNKAIIISGFSGIGKTYLSKNNRQVIDLESGIFQYGVNPNDNHEHQKGDTSRQLNSNWLEEYLDAIENSQHDYKYILIAQFPELLDGLRKRNLKFVMVCPTLEQKEIYKDRFKRRGNRKSWIDKSISKYEYYLEVNQKYAKENNIPFIQLSKDTYLENILQEIDNIKFSK